MNLIVVPSNAVHDEFDEVRFQIQPAGVVCRIDIQVSGAMFDIDYSSVVNPPSAKTASKVGQG